MVGYTKFLLGVVCYDKKEDTFRQIRGKVRGGKWVVGSGANYYNDAITEIYEYNKLVTTEYIIRNLVIITPANIRDYAGEVELMFSGKVWCVKSYKTLNERYDEKNK